jgi:beta-N-acetylhexosaminidase
MNLNEKIGQMLVLGWMGDSEDELLTLSDRPRRMVADMHVGGVILMTRNTRTPDQMRKLTGDLQALAAESDLPPLLICIDQEGGPKTRLTPPHFRASRDMWAVGETGDPREARAEAAAIGNELKSMGINWDLAPVLDVNNNPANPVIGRRSFGDDPSKVATMAAEAVRGLQGDAGVMACGKHFPGHGDTSVDSHAALPVIEHSLDRLQSVELSPFRSAIDAGIASIMTSHILFPALDPELPATLSRRILTGLLRGTLGFEGVIVTDCLEMRGVAGRWSYADAAVLSVQAGADMLLCCHTPDAQAQVRVGLLEAVRSGRITEQRIDVSLERVLKAKARWAKPVGSTQFAVA